MDCSKNGSWTSLFKKFLNLWSSKFRVYEVKISCRDYKDKNVFKDDHA